MTYTVHPKVEADLDEAALHLAEQASERTVERFFAEFERVVELLVQHPGLGTPMSRGRRMHLFRVFKFALVYRLVDGMPRISLVRHQRRRPSFGGGRR